MDFVLAGSAASWQVPFATHSKWSKFGCSFKDGLLALQKGLVPFVCYQFTVNATRLGLFQVMNDKGWTKNAAGQVHPLKTLILATSSGALGGFVCSPFYLVKTHLQSKANEISIAVGHQHQHSGMFHALSSIFREQGVRGLWRGTTSNIPRIAAASAGQLSSFELTHEFMKSKFPGQVWVPLCCSSFVAGLFITTLMAPFDLIATRFFNQGTDANGKGLFYKNVFDCAAKVRRKEGFLAFFKGWTACYFRLGPYTMLVMVFWDRLKYQYKSFTDHNNSRVILPKETA
ncbi:Solute carrier family 25 member 35 [Orchesella cincta]|uniref:Solute carrier family 25 member 35 n=1 Tax=Orchesella cincta TaxID=48709 RepID=A0A1D2MSM5_ORCCI|nr:Solute carrier family 25 member 35 [Orchesella cincta]